MPSKFRLQIIELDTGNVVQWEPGRSTEIDFLDDCTNRIIAKGVGVFRTSNHVAQDIRDGLTEAIHALKSKVPPTNY